MIFGRHLIGGVTFRPPTDREGGSANVLTVEQGDLIETHDPRGLPTDREVTLKSTLDRSEVERLRDLCDEALR